MNYVGRVTHPVCALRDQTFRMPLGPRWTHTGLTHFQSNALEPSCTQLNPTQLQRSRRARLVTAKASATRSINCRCNVTLQTEVLQHGLKSPDIKVEDNCSSVVQRATSVFLSALLAVSLVPAAPAEARKYTQDEQLTIDIFQKNTPSVVNVTNLATRRDAFTLNTLEVPQGAGSGFIWDKDGHVVTNYHVISDASDIQVTLTGGSEFTAKVVGVDQDKDIAVLEIQSSETTPVEDLKPLGLCSSSADLVVGQRVYAIGNPFGLDHTLTTGVVSGTGREIQSISGRPIQDVIQTDAAINPGNSGGPLLDTAGCLIGINTAIFSPSGANSGVGFAIPVDIVRSSVNQIIQYGKVVRPVLGISFAPDQSSEQLGVKGILVLSAKEGGPAFKAGVHGTTRDTYGRLVLGDIITGINGQSIKNASDLYRILDKASVGDSLDVEVLRGNTKEHVDIVLEANA